MFEKYYVKSRNKFGHIVELNEMAIEQADLIHFWLDENIGKYQIEWRAPPRKLSNKPIGEFQWCYPYAFKTEDAAMAFKLRWEE